MAVITRILCPVDLSDQSRHALDEAVALGRHYGAAVTALYVIPPISPVPATLEAPVAYVYTPEELDAIDAEVRAFVHAEEAGRAVEVSVVEGPVVGSILARAEALRADLIVIGTHGRSGVQRVILGSVAERVLAHATCPVMTVPPRSSDAVPFGRSMFSRVLCAVDHSPSALKALELATVLAREADATLTLVNVIEPATAFEPVLATIGGSTEYQEAVMTGARAHVHRLAPPDLARRSRVRELVVTGKPYPAILQLARDEKVDLIVCGAHGGLNTVLGIGSTTNHIVRDALCPVISVRA